METKVTYTLVRKRLLKTFAVFAFFMVYLIGRLAWVQFINGDELRNKAAAQWNRGLTVQPQRGSIYSRNLSLLAGSATAESIIAIPTEIKDIEGTATALAPLLAMDPEDLKEKMGKKQFEVFLKRKVEDEVALAVKALKLPGIRTKLESKRFYPAGNLASHVLGFVGIDEGLEGIEYYYEKELKGEKGYVVYEADAKGRELPDAVQAYLPPVNGYDLVLAIDEVIQHIVEKELDQAMIDYAPERAGIVAVDPKTGEILAMAGRPDFYPEKYGEYNDSVWRNPIISHSFEPGSTFKLVTISAALEEGIVTLNDGYYCRGYFTASGRNIKCWSSGHGSQTIKQVLWNSCNPGFMHMGTQLGKEKMFDYIRAYSYGARTGIDLPGENPGVLFNVDTMSNADLAVTSFGQGNAVTPIQQVMAAAAIANGGKLMQPMLVKEVRDENGNTVKKNEPKVLRQVISEETAKELSQALAEGVEKGSGVFSLVEGYRMAGKTGTAEKIAPGGGYLNNIYVLSYVGYGPIDDPRIAVYVFVDGATKGPNWGGQVAGPIFKNVVSQVMRYWNIPPDGKEVEPNLPEDIRVPSFVNMNLQQVMEQAEREGFSLRIEGDGELVTGQIPVAGANVPFGSMVIVYTGFANQEKNEITLPNITGLSLREVSELLNLYGLRLETTGSGIAIKQDPEPGAEVELGTVVKVFFGEPGAE